MARSRCDPDKNSVVVTGDADSAVKAFFARKNVIVTESPSDCVQAVTGCTVAERCSYLDESYVVVNCNPIDTCTYAIGSISAGAAFATLGQVIFSNSNGVSFGVTGQTVTASFSGGGGGSGGVAISASGSSKSNGTVVFSNSNGLSFGMNGATVTGSYTVPTQSVQPGIQSVSAGTTQVTTGQVIWSNSNGISFGADGQTITASYTVPAIPAAGSISAGTTSATLGQVIFSNSNSVSFGMNGGTVTATVAYPAQTTQPGIQSVSAGTTRVTTGEVVWSNSNGISFGADGQTITASYTVPTQTNQSVGLYALSNTTLSTSGTQDARSLSFAGAGIISVGVTNGSVLISASAAGAADGWNIIAAGTQTANTTGTILFSNSNGISFGMSNSSIVTASYTVPTQSTQPGIQSVSAGTTRVTTGEVVWSNSNGISFGADGQTITASYTVPSVPAAGSISAGTTSATLGQVIFSNSNSVSFGMNGGTVTATVAYPAQSTQPGIQSVSAGTTRVTTGEVVWSNSNGISFGADGQTITASYTVPSVPAETPFGVSAGTQSVSTGTLVFSNSNNVTFGMSGSSRITASASFPAETPFGVSAGTQSVSTGTLVFSNSNGISFGMSGSSQITASYTVPAIPAAGSISAGTTSATLGQVIFSNSNSVSFGMNAGTVTATVSYPAQTTQPAIQSISAGTTRVTTGEVVWSNSNGISFGADGQTITASYTVPAIPAAGSISAGTTSATLGQVIFSNSNSVSFGMNAGTVTATVAYPAQTNQTIGLYMSSNSTSSVSSGTVDARSMTFRGAGIASVGYSAGEVVISVPAGAPSPVNFSAGTTSGNLDSVVFSNSNNVSFGLNGSTVTASYALNLSAGTTSNNLSAVTFANSNGISFGLNASTLTASYTVPAIPAAGSISAGTTSATLGQVIFSNSNSVSFGMNAGTVTATVSYPAQTTQPGIQSISAGTTRVTTGEVVWSNSNGISFGANGQTITASYTVPSVPAETPFGVSAGTQSVSTGTLVFSNSNGITFGMSGSSRITASHDGITSQTNQTLGIYAVVNTTGQSSSSTYDARSLTIIGAGNISVGWTNGSFGIEGNNKGTLSFYQNIPNFQPMVTGASGITQTSGSSIFIQPFFMPMQASVGYAKFLVSLNDSAVGTAGTTSANQTFSVERYTTIGLVVYTQGTGASSVSLMSLMSTSAGITGRTIYQAGAQGSRYTITLQKTFPGNTVSNNLYTTSYAVSSGSIVISSNSNTLFTGPVFLDIPWATSISNNAYWLGIGASTSSASNSSHISFAGTAAMPMTIAGVSQSNVTVALMGSATSASAIQLIPGLGVWTTNASGFSRSNMGFNSISNVVSNPQIVFQLIRAV